MSRSYGWRTDPRTRQGSQVATAILMVILCSTDIEVTAPPLSQTKNDVPTKYENYLLTSIGKPTTTDNRREWLYGITG